MQIIRSITVNMVSFLVFYFFLNLCNVAMANDFAVTITFADDNGKQYHNVSSANVQNNNWFKLSGSYTYQPNGQVKKQPFIYIEGPNEGVNFYVDSLMVIDENNHNIVQDINADLELGTTNYWFGNGVTKLSLASSVVQSGQHSLLATNREDRWQGPALSLKDKLIAGRSYVISVWVKLADKNAANLSQQAPQEVNQPAKVNTDMVYFYQGKTYGSWGLSLGDNDNWVLPATGLSATSAANQLTMTPAIYKKGNDAINLKWSRKKGKGQFAIYGSEIDLTNVEHRAALTMEIKVLNKPKKGVTIGMDCGYPCRSEIYIHKTLRELPKGKWQTFPIPLDCFSAKGLDVSKINGVFVLATEGKFEVELANIRMALLPEGAPTCQ